MPPVVPVLRPFHRHICTLKAFAAVAARSQIDRDSSAVSNQIRTRLGTQLCDWCDDFFDSLSEWPNITSLAIPDAVWMPPTNALRYFGNREFQSPSRPEIVAVFVQIVNHIEWESFPQDRFHPDHAIAKWLIHYLPIYADAALYVHRECRPMFLAMLTRLYKHPRISHSHTLLMTRILLTGGIPSFVRDHIRQVLPRYFTELELAIGMTQNPVSKLSVAIAGGDLEYIASHTDETLIIPNWQRLTEEACHTCDEAIFQCLWIFRTRMRTNVREKLLGVMCAALSASNPNVLRLVFDELSAREISYSNWTDLLWSLTHDTLCASVLIERCCPVHNAIFNVSDPATVQLLLLHGAPVTPPSVQAASDAISYDVHIAQLLIRAWTNVGLPTEDYLRAAIRVCENPLVLRDLTRMLDSCTSTVVPTVNPRMSSIDLALLNPNRTPTVKLIKACLHLGADINAQDPENGRTALINAVLASNGPAMRFLLHAGASTVLRDHKGMTALAHYNHRRLHLPGMHDKLARYMGAQQSVLQSTPEPQNP